MSTEPLTKDNRLAVRSELIRIAAALAKGEYVPHEFDSDNFYVSTPRAERRRIIAACEKIEEDCKVLAIKLRDLADRLNAEHRREPSGAQEPSRDMASKDRGFLLDEIERLTSALDGVRRCTNYHECDCRERVTKALRGEESRGGPAECRP